MVTRRLLLIKIEIIRPKAFNLRVGTILLIVCKRHFSQRSLICENAIMLLSWVMTHSLSRLACIKRHTLIILSYIVIHILSDSRHSSSTPHCLFIPVILLVGLPLPELSNARVVELNSRPRKDIDFTL